MRNVGIAAILMLAASAPAATNLGLAVTFSAGGKSHTTSRSNIALYVAQGEAPSPFLPPGPFTALWEGNVHADLRGEFFFQAESSGGFTLEINGSRVDTALGKPASLSKGANKIKATYASPNAGDAWLRLFWTEKGTNTSPVPWHVLSHARVNDELELGRELFLEFRCNHCHAEIKNGGVPELAMDAPSFEGIGGRRNAAWMARWIMDPKAERPSARMPKLVKSADEAEAMAAFLGTLTTAGTVTRGATNTSIGPPEGKTLYEALLCASCHADGGISLEHVAEKFLPGKLAEYLLAPEGHYSWTRMPNFKLSPKEAETLADELLAGRAVPGAPKPEDGLISKGRGLIQSRGCLNCHSLKVENTFTAPKLGRDWNKGCVSGGSNAPQFGFTAAQRDALRAFGSTDRTSLTRHVPAEFAARQIRLLNCRACHGQQELFPPIDILGGKLRPEWSAEFISGKISYKPRAETHPNGDPWLFARMPAFKAHGPALAYGMSALHGYPPRSAKMNADPDLAKIGQKLVGKEGGFSCVSCHGVGPVKATDVFDSEGINLGWSAERLLPEYYRRWVRNPIAIDPQTKMPVYFDEEGRSPLTEVLEGDGDKQLTAMWHYLLMADKMPPP